jgi:hypothetical protein
MLRPIATLLLVTVVAALLSACGNEQADHEDAFRNSHPVDLLIPDCSASFRQTSKQLVPEMVTVTLDSARQKRVLWAGCFAGAPLRTLAWKPKIDFGDLPDSLNDNPTFVEHFNEARALGLRRKLAAMVRHTPRRAPGSGQLEALELASQTKGVGRVFLFTDALIVEPEGLDLRTATPSDIHQAISLWAPRLTGLRGVELMLVGVGYGANNSRSVRNAARLFSGLAHRVGAGSFSWTQSLPADFSDS